MPVAAGFERFAYAANVVWIASVAGAPVERAGFLRATGEIRAEVRAVVAAHLVSLADTTLTPELTSGRQAAPFGDAAELAADAYFASDPLAVGAALLESMQLGVHAA
jgi:hypothetical protein